MLNGNYLVKPWQGYVFALGTTAATLAVRLALDAPLGGRPTLVIFTLPIILSAYMGGLRAGLLATGLSYFAASYYVLPPIYSFRVASGIERWQQFFVALAGVIISALNEALHRARNRADMATGEERRAAAALQESEGRYRALVEWAPDAIEVHRDGKLLFVNRAAMTLFGATSAQDLVGKPILDLVHPDSHQRVLERLKKHAIDGMNLPKIELRFITLDGVAMDVEVQGTSIVYDGQPAILRSICDITERKRMEAAAARLAAIVESSDDAIVGKDLQGIVTSWNAAAEKIFGYAASEMIGQSIRRLIPPERQGEEAMILRQIGRGKNVRHFETVRARKDGSVVDVSVTVSAIRDSSGRIVGASKVAREITERKKAEATLRELSVRLLRLEDEERRRLARELHDSTAQRLAALCMNLSVANEAAGALDARAQRAMEESATLADECLREIRTVAYLLHPSEVDHVGLPSALARYIDGFVQRSGISVETEVAADLGRLPEALETTVFRIVQECLTNIHRHSGSNTARIRLRRSRSDLVLEVQDAGTGVRSDAPPGVGIVSMQERLEPFGGSLEISSRPDGTRVKAVVPLVRGAA